MQKTLIVSLSVGLIVAGAFEMSTQAQVVNPRSLPAAKTNRSEHPTPSEHYIWPTSGEVKAGYGWRWGQMHHGIDIEGASGTPILAAAAGTVTKAGWNDEGYGKLVEIRHADGTLTRYAHNQRLLVAEGHAVQQGQVIAEMGSTGYSTGPHCHFEILLPGQGAVDPMAYLPAPHIAQRSRP